MDVPEVHFADAKGLKIVWSQFGSGPDVLAIPPFLSNIELAWEHEFYRRFLEYMAQHVRVTVFDKRGIGLSDRFAEPPTLEQRIDDIGAVMNAAGLERAVVFGASEGGLMSQLFAALHPERVKRLVLLNTHPGASGLLAAHRALDPSMATFTQFRTRMETIFATWGQDPQYFVDYFSPSYSDNAAYVRWHGRLQRQSATEADARRQSVSLHTLDAADRLRDIVAPTLLLHATHDPVMPIGAARGLVDKIRGSRLVEYEGVDHIGETSPQWLEILTTWLEFATGAPLARQTQRRLATVLFTDIVDSTARTAAAGDGAWRQLLDSHDRLAWAAAARHSGTIVKSTGDGLLARFDAPSQALECAAELRRDLATIGLDIRCGLHAGEIELRDNGDIAGTAVNLAARVEQAADAGQVMVSSTVHDVLLGSRYRFVDRGDHTLKGFDAPWRLYSLAE